MPASCIILTSWLAVKLLTSYLPPSIFALFILRRGDQVRADVESLGKLLRLQSCYRIATEPYFELNFRSGVTMAEINEEVGSGV